MIATVYRVQDAEGRGPYRPGMSGRWCDPGHEARNPAVWDETGPAAVETLPRGRHAGCGFLTLGALAAWFTGPELSALERLGYGVVRLPGATIHARGGLQVMFWRDRPHTAGAKPVPWGSIHSDAAAAA